MYMAFPTVADPADRDVGYLSALPCQAWHGYGVSIAHHGEAKKLPFSGIKPGTFDTLGHKPKLTRRKRMGGFFKKRSCKKPLDSSRQIAPPLNLKFTSFFHS
jgi:hypothetical protein